MEEKEKTAEELIEEIIEIFGNSTLSRKEIELALYRRGLIRRELKVSPDGEVWLARKQKLVMLVDWSMGYIEFYKEITWRKF